MNTRRPNILLVHWHDLGTHLGAYGVGSVESPNVDRLAAHGLRFDKAFCTAPLCSPARGALFTGRYPHANGLMGLTHYGWEYTPGEYTLPMLLAAAGYQTALIGLQHESSDSRSLGFDEVHRAPGTLQFCRPVTDVAVRWLAANAHIDRPFFLTVGFFETHRPYPTTQYDPADPTAVEVPEFLPDNAWTRDDLACFQGSIRAADVEFGRLLSALDQTGRAEETWVIFTTDHGVAFPRAKSTLYDPGIRVALIMRFPRSWSTRSGATDRLVSHVDLVPTVLEGLGLGIPAAIQGISHADWLSGHDVAGRDAIYAEKNFHDCYDPMRGIRTTRYKYIRSYEERPLLPLAIDLESSPTRYGYGDDHLRHRPFEELYDLGADPLEAQNLVANPDTAAIRAQLAAQLDSWQRGTNDPLLHGQIRAPARPREPKFGALVEQPSAATTRPGSRKNR